jgi:coproporphyrinogen III oxidase
MNRAEITEWLKDLQDRICSGLESLDGTARFTEQLWTREEGGGGRSRVIRDGDLLEKGGVMFSAVHGAAPAFLRNDASINPAASGEPAEFYATGVSIVLHPQNPFVPIIHMNIRYFEMGNKRWLGGGIDVTPHYVSVADAAEFHRSLRNMCDRHHTDYYNRFRIWADDYFFIPHRNETRGIGGIFFDRLTGNESMDFASNLEFWKDTGELFLRAYAPLTEQNRKKRFTEAHRQWQLQRRGRYVEFNLVYDKGTRFGLESNGRIESILVSLPPLAAWEYYFKPAEGSEEWKTQQLLRKGVDWENVR